MTRSFSGAALDHDLLDDLCASALWAPTAGNSAGVRMTTTTGEGVARFLETATDPEWRATSPRATGISRAGGVVVVTSRPQDYLTRYGEPDKRGAGLDEESGWAVPYWHTDAAMATMALLLLVEERGLGAVLWGNFRHESEVLELIGAPDERVFAHVLIGHPDEHDERSTSLSRPTPPRQDRVRRFS